MAGDFQCLKNLINKAHGKICQNVGILLKLGLNIGGGFALLYFGLLWLLDFPKPFIDDLFFCGTALNMAGGGELTNPLLAWFPGQPYFFQPPVHSYFLTGWLKLFGISAAAMTGFQMTMYFSLTAAVIAILRKNQSPGWLGLLVPLAVTAAFLDCGLRQEPLAAALAMVGFAMIECGARKIPLVFLALLLMFLGSATAPRMTLFGAALVLLSGQRLWRDSAESRQRWKFFFLGLGAFLVSGLIFLWMIHFRITEFWKVFHIHAQHVVLGKEKNIHSLLQAHFGIKQKLYLLVGGAMAFFAFKYRADRLIQICVAIGLVFPIEFYNGFLGYGPGGWFALFLIMLLCAVLSKKKSLVGRGISPIALCSLLLWLNASNFVEAFGILSGHIQSECGDQQHEALMLTSTADHPLLLDSSVARYVFDYRIPQGSIDFLFCAPFPNSRFESAYHSQDIYLLSPCWYDYVVRNTYLESQPRPQWSMLKMVIRPKSMQGFYC